MLLVLHGRTVERRLEHALGEIGLSLRTFGILGHLSTEPGRSLSDIARRAHITPQSVQVIVRGLADSGVVASLTEGGRGRAATLELTPLGRQRMQQAREIIADFDRTLFTEGSPAWQTLGTALLATPPTPPGLRQPDPPSAADPTAP